MKCEVCKENEAIARTFLGELDKKGIRLLIHSMNCDVAIRDPNDRGRQPICLKCLLRKITFCTFKGVHITCDDCLHNMKIEKFIEEKKNEK